MPNRVEQNEQRDPRTGRLSSMLGGKARCHRWTWLLTKGESGVTEWWEADEGRARLPDLLGYPSHYRRGCPAGDREHGSRDGQATRSRFFHDDQ